jgi:hypothetical protein
LLLGKSDPKEKTRDKMTVPAWEAGTHEIRALFLKSEERASPSRYSNTENIVLEEEGYCFADASKLPLTT